MIVRDCMTTDPISANLLDGLHQTYTRMRERGIRHMPVLDTSGRLAGIVSERDLLRPSHIDSSPNVSNYFALTNTIKVSEAMTDHAITINAEAPVSEVLELFLKHRFGALPVVDGDNMLLGIVSTVDMLRAFKKSLEA